jgi:hypothetical protein
MHARAIAAGFVLRSSLCVLLIAGSSSAQSLEGAGDSSPLPAADGRGSAQPEMSVLCESVNNQRQHCPADTSAGVALMRSTGSGACLLGKTWGYDDTGVWVSDNCGGEFALGEAAGASTAQAVPAAGAIGAPQRKPAERIETWGEFDPGQGFLVGRSGLGELAISAYALIRYIDQTPASQTFTDHLGVEHSVDGRNDLFPHRIMVFLKGWIGNPKLIYNIFFWTVNPTDQKNIFAVMGYQFTRRFSLYAGLNGLPGTRSTQGSHPYWLGHDRVMADEYFRPYFSNGVWAQGELTPGLWYNVMAANNLSALGFKATQLDRRWGTGASMWWMPTTKEFGPKGAYGDYERHDKVATRIGFSSTYAPEEQRYTDSVTGAAGSTLIKLADSVNVFDTGALAPGVTVQNVNYRLLSIDAGMKYKGFFLQTEIYNRWLDGFKADGPLPVSSIHDFGYYVQGAFYPVPKKLEVYGATSQIYGDTSAGYTTSSEYLGGGNFYPFDTRNIRWNAQIQKVNHSPVGSTFGYYTAGQNGTTFSTAFSIFF